jgi:hypothetical protein
MTKEPKMTNHPSKTKQIAAAVLALLCASSSAYACKPVTDNCFRTTSKHEAFNQDSPDSDNDGIPDHDDADPDNDGK